MDRSFFRALLWVMLGFVLGAAVVMALNSARQLRSKNVSDAQLDALARHEK
jgi:hypothetical protein